MPGAKSGPGMNESIVRRKAGGTPEGIVPSTWRGTPGNVTRSESWGGERASLVGTDELTTRQFP